MAVLDTNRLTTVDALYRVARDGGREELLARAEEPAQLGVIDGEVVFIAGSEFAPNNTAASSAFRCGTSRRPPSNPGAFASPRSAC
ncbi:hypothetical protein [Sandaracinus amylolyticus]|uniref:hypothetical protein n=1 Tax=Sandaracinus amylolyticus TaxID=927083 RepID=UPI0012EE61D1|nr:hypothetical protein [Sandaracinus amylolyticus]